MPIPTSHAGDTALGAAARAIALEILTGTEPCDHYDPDLPPCPEHEEAMMAEIGRALLGAIERADGSPWPPEREEDDGWD